MTSTIQVPSRAGTYAIKAYTQQGVESINATFITTDVATVDELNVVEDVTEGPTIWNGTHNDTAILTDMLQLGNDEVIAAWATLASVTDSL